jgi:hypothetical protein
VKPRPNAPKKAIRTPRELLLLSDAELLAQCELDAYRASGPGGQKRNKTSSAVRIRHEPTGLLVTASESRSQHENRARALRRLREALALTQRSDIDLTALPPAFFAAAIARDASLHVNPRHADYWPIVQYVLDVIAASGVSVAEAAVILRISTGQLVRFLKGDAKLWAQVNQMRAAADLPALR